MFFVVCFALLVSGCELPLSDPNPHGSDADHAQVDTNHTQRESAAKDAAALRTCEELENTIGALDLNGERLTSDHEIAMPKGAHDLAYYLYAMPYSQDGDELSDEELVWGLADKTLATIVSHAWNNGIVEVSVQRDYFDAAGEEPASVAGVCVADPCEIVEPIIYPRPACAKFRVIGLVNLEGTWRIITSMLPFALEINVYQKGRELMLTGRASKEHEAFLFKNVVVFETGVLRYQCMLTSRTHCEGTVIDTQSKEVIETWSADKQ